MKWEAPETVLVIFVLAAAGCLLGGVRMARHTEVHRIDRPREAHSELVEELRLELVRLEQLYESHLGRLVSESSPRDVFALERAAERVAGVRQVSLIRRESRAQPDRHWRIGKATGAPENPVPYFDEEGAPLDGPSVLLDWNRLMRGSAFTG